jgi:hypothetical protein
MCTPSEGYKTGSLTYTSSAASPSKQGCAVPTDGSVSKSDKFSISTLVPHNGDADWVEKYLNQLSSLQGFADSFMLNSVFYYVALIPSSQPHFIVNKVISVPSCMPKCSPKKILPIPLDMAIPESDLRVLDGIFKIRNISLNGIGYDTFAHAIGDFPRPINDLWIDPHYEIQLTKDSQNSFYFQIREFGEMGLVVSDIDLTSHRSTKHDCPHRHLWVPPQDRGSYYQAKREGAIPLPSDWDWNAVIPRILNLKRV